MPGSNDVVFPEKTFKPAEVSATESGDLKITIRGAPEADFPAGTIATVARNTDIGSVGTFGIVPKSKATAFTIKEITGEKRKLELLGRCLPYRPLTFSGTMRADVVYYPGNPIPTVQMLGATEEETTITGMWKDRFIKGEAISSGSNARLDNSPLIDAKAIVDVVDDFRRKGQLLEVTWDAFYRRGIITKFEQTWDRRQDVAWSLTFRFLDQGDDEEAPDFYPELFNPTDFSSMLSNQYEKNALLMGKALYERAIQKLRQSTTALQERVNQLSQASDFIGGVGPSSISPSNTLMSAMNEYMNTFSQLVIQSQRVLDTALNGTITKLEFTESTLTQMTNTIDAAVAYSKKLRKRPLQDYLLATQQQTVVGKVLAVVTVVRGLSARMSGFARSISSSRSSLKANKSKGSGLNTAPTSMPFIARQGDDLRKVARITLGSSAAWRFLAQYNNLVTSELEPGQKVYIPPKNIVPTEFLKGGI